MLTLLALSSWSRRVVRVVDPVLTVAAAGPCCASHRLRLTCRRCYPRTFPGWGRATLALTAIIATGAALFGFPVLNLTFSAAFLGEGLGSEAWQHGPVLVATGIALVAGLLALRQAALHGSRSWVKALAGAAVLVSSAVAIGTIIVWIFAPDSNPFQEIGVPFPGETPPTLGN
jgi:hypothetical protein